MLHIQHGPRDIVGYGVGNHIPIGIMVYTVAVQHTGIYNIPLRQGDIPIARIDDLLMHAKYEGCLSCEVWLVFPCMM